MRIREEMRDLEGLEDAVRQFAHLARGYHVFHYRGEEDDLDVTDYESFDEFKDDLSEIDIHAVGVGVIVNVP